MLGSVYLSTLTEYLDMLSGSFNIFLRKDNKKTLSEESVFNFCGGPTWD
jgi:hypothetical protein